MHGCRSSGFVNRNVCVIAGFVLAWFTLTGFAQAQAPAITAVSAPRQVVTINQNLTLSVTTTGATSYQWKRNGLPISGATAASYTITGAISYRDNGWYQAVATNSSGSTTSAVIFVNVVVDPAQIVGSGHSYYGEATAPENLSSVAAVAAGDDFSFALRGDGTVMAWGHSLYGRTTLPGNLSGVVAVSAGYGNSLALKSDGTVVALGDPYNNYPIPSGLSDIVALAAGGGHSLALKSDGTVVGWGGGNTYGEATVPNGLSGVVAVASGSSFSLALKSDGSVVGWGRGLEGQITIPSGLSSVVAVAAGTYHGLALKKDGTVVAWGAKDSSPHGQATVPTGLSGVVAVEAGSYHSLALKSDGTVVGWGKNDYDQATLPRGAGTVATMSAGFGISAHNLFITGKLPFSADVLVASKFVTVVEEANFTPVAGRGGSVTYTYSVTPALPAGLGLNTRNGAISGVARTAASAASYTITVRDAANVAAGSVSGSFTLTINSALAAATAVANKALPFGVTVAPFVPVTGTGGVPPYAYAISPSLPTGLSLNTANGTITGVPTAAKLATTYSVTVTDDVGTKATERFNLTVKPAFTATAAVSAKALPVNAAAAAFTPVVPAGGTAPYTFAVSPALPAGLSLSASTGAITGTPTVLSPTSSYAVRTTDADGLTASRSFSLTVTPSFPVITPVSALRQTVALNANLTLSVTPGDATSYQWMRNGRPLPGATTTSYTIAAAQPLRDNGWYQVVAANSYGSTTSAAIFVNVPIAPAQVVGNGLNQVGQITIPSGLTSVSALAAGYVHSLALKSDGTVVAWGTNFQGQTAVPSGLVDVVAVSGGYLQSFALKSDGTVVGWGSNANGELNIPAGLSDVVAISAGRNHCLALKGDGTLAAWGYNGSGQTSVPRDLDGVVAIAAGSSHNLALKNDGTVVAWHDLFSSRGQAVVPADLSDVVAVAAGDLHSLALKRDGTVVGWGANTYGQATIPSGLSGVVAIAASETHSLALKSDGTVVAWGGNMYGQTTLPVGLGTVTMLSTASTSRHSLFLALSLPLSASAAVSGKVLTVGAAASFTPVGAVAGASPHTYRVTPALPAGLSLDSATGAISGTPLVSAAAATFTITVTDSAGASASQSFTLAVNNAPLITALSAPQQTVALNQNLTLSVTATGATSYQWRRNGQSLAGATTASYAITGAVPLHDGGWYQVVATNASGSTTSTAIFVNVAVSPALVVASGDNVLGQLLVPSGLTSVLAVSAGGYHSLALKGDGTVAGWGYNDNRPITIPSGLSGVVAVSAGGYHSLALKSDGTVAAWGAVLNNYGQTTIPSGLSGVVQVAAGSGHSLALKGDATVAAWGLNFSGQATIPVGLSDVVAVAAGQEHSLALKSDGTVTAWGRNDSGQTVVPAGLSGVVAVSAGNHHNLALKSDSTVVAWGHNDFGQAAVPGGLSGVVAVSGGQYHSLAFKSDGTVVAWGRNDFGQTTIPGGLDGLMQVSAGSLHNVFLRAGTARPPEVTSTPVTRTMTMGESVTLTVAVTGTGPLSYQWRRNGFEISGATGATYTLSNVAFVSSSGTYSVSVTDSVGQVTATIATITVVQAPATASRLANVSVRTGAGTGDQTLIVGLAIGGAGAKQVLLRGIGPGLTQFGLTGALADPQIRLFSAAGGQTNMNEDWGGGAALMDAFTMVGAFALPGSSKDAALLVSLDPGTYSAQVTANGTGGTALVEAYDSSAATSTARLVNLSVRTQVGTGDNVLIVGFVLAGRSTKTVLIRAVGPGLAPFGVGGVLADPQLSLFKSGITAPTHTNDNWGGGQALSNAYTATGAFNLAFASKDSALLVTLDPGAYTAQVSGVGGATGVALVEVYEVP